MKLNNTICPICSNKKTELFITREHVPVHQNLLITDKNYAIKLIKGNLKLYVCPSCGFIYNTDFDESLLSYSDMYDNTQSYSPLFSEYVNNLTNHLITNCNVKNKKIIEVGCGNGEFITELCKSKEGRNTGIGFDPSYKGINDIKEHRISFKREFYDSNSIRNLKDEVDIVICRHVIEHVSNPLELLSNIKSTLINSPESRLFLETPCVNWILNNKVIWDFFYEHCSYFSHESLTTALEMSGFQVKNINHVFGGQYLWVEAFIPSEKVSITKNDANTYTYTLAKEFSTSEKVLIEKWKKRIEKLKSKGNIAIWGAGAKGTTFANLIDKECKLINCVVDLNPKKQNKYIYGTGHPIINYYELTNRNIKYVILMNPNYKSEITTLLREAYINIELIQ